MSKIVILDAELDAPAIIADLLAKFKARDPSSAKWIETFNPIPLIEECVKSALNLLGEQEGVTLSDEMEDYNGNTLSTYNGRELAGVLKTSKLSNGVGIVVDEQGKINFAADTYTGEWESEADRLREMFTDAFLSECLNSVLEILEYDSAVSAVNIGSGEIAFEVEGEKE